MGSWRDIFADDAFANRPAGAHSNAARLRRSDALDRCITDRRAAANAVDGYFSALCNGAGISDYVRFRSGLHLIHVAAAAMLADVSSKPYLCKSRGRSAPGIVVCIGVIGRPRDISLRCNFGSHYSDSSRRASGVFFGQAACRVVSMIVGFRWGYRLLASLWYERDVLHSAHQIHAAIGGSKSHPTTMRELRKQRLCYGIRKIGGAKCQQES